MNDVLTKITSLAVSVFRQWNTEQQHYDLFIMEDGVLREMQRLSFLGHSRNAAAEAVPNILTEPDFSAILATDGDLTPMVLTAGGGSRMSPADILNGLLTSAAVQIYLLRLANDEATFVRAVLDNFEELRRAVRGEKARAYYVTGIAGITLSEGKHVTTPWGVLRPAPQAQDNHAFMFHRPKTTCTLIEQKLVSVKFDLAREPKHSFDKDEQRSPKANLLFPLACALSSNDTDNPAGPIETWSTLLLPFQAGFGYSQSMLAPRMQQNTSLDNDIDVLETISKTIDTVHSSTIDVAATRLVSSVGHRIDHSDALIDAVMVWENLLGTSTEVTISHHQ